MGVILHTGYGQKPNNCHQIMIQMLGQKYVYVFVNWHEQVNSDFSNMSNDGSKQGGNEF